MFAVCTVSLGFRGWLRIVVVDACVCTWCLVVVIVIKSVWFGLLHVFVS